MAAIISLLQGVLFSARENKIYHSQGYTKTVLTPGQNSFAGDSSEFYPEGFALAQSILPIIEDADPSAARDIAAVMVDGFPNSAEDAASNDSAKVRRAVISALTKMDGIHCSEIGSLGGQGFCPGDFDNLGGTTSRSSIPWAFFVLAGMLIFALFS